MGKFRLQNCVREEEQNDVLSRFQVPLTLQHHQHHQLVRLLPPPPPLQPRPNLLTPESDEDAGTPTEDQPLDYSMKKLQQQQPHLHTAHHSEEILHKLRNTVLLKRDNLHHQLSLCQSTEQQLAQQHHALLQPVKQHQVHRFPTPQQQQQQQHSVVDSDTDSKAVYAAECIKSRLEGCGKRVHLFLGILLHFGMPPGPKGEQIFERVIAFSDENKNLTDRPTSYFMVLDSRLLALIWCKFKGNSSNEYSTLTRAIRSTRQKYKGIFETVENPGKKLYKFGPIAVDQFRHLFPSSYSPQQQQQLQQQQQFQAKREAA